MKIREEFQKGNFELDFNFNVEKTRNKDVEELVIYVCISYMQ